MSDDAVLALAVFVLGTIFTAWLLSAISNWIDK